MSSKIILIAILITLIILTVLVAVDVMVRLFVCGPDLLAQATATPSPTASPSPSPTLTSTSPPATRSVTVTPTASPTPATPKEEIVLTVDRDHIEAGECITLKVRVESISAAWLEGEPVVGGEAEKEVCPCEDTIYTLEVTLASGEQAKRTVTVYVEGECPEIKLTTRWPSMKLQDWPRPEGDNGRGMHFLVEGYYTDEELDFHIARLRDMNVKWCLVIYKDELHLERAAIKFREAGIMVVWRKFLRPDQLYFNWGRDIEILEQVGMPPYMQVYNEPAVGQEWEDEPINKEKFLKNLRRTCQDVYNAGGYIGLQFVSEEWLTDALRDLKAHGGERIFQRMFFIPHPYGMNHPPSYQEDVHSALGFLVFADIFQKEIGFVPPMIAGEGGFKYGATDDARFPKVDDQLHRDYHVELFNWFRTGVLSNGQPLPDYFFAYCVWLISDRMDDNAWYDSFAGDRVLTIEAIKAIPPFKRQFSWDKTP
jgi:hypothetical protein